MKKIIVAITLLLTCFQAFCQTITPDMGRRLTYWTHSDDTRRAYVLRILENHYQIHSYSTLERKIDSFSSNPDDAWIVFVGIYNYMGPDYGYAAFKDSFTKAQMAIIDQVYVSSGGTIKKERTDAERKKQSTLAAKRGVTTDMARRLKTFCYQYPNMQFVVSSALSEKGVSNFGIYRIIDAFEDNLDYVEAAIFALYDREGGIDRAYHSLRLFLSSSQIEFWDSRYAIMDAERKEIRNNKILEYVSSISAQEPYPLSEDKVSVIASKSRSAVEQIMRECPEMNYSISIRDSLFTNKGHDSGFHKVYIALSPSIKDFQNQLKTKIETIAVKPERFYNEELEYAYYPLCQGYYEFTYELSQQVYCFQVEHKRLKQKEIDAEKERVRLACADSQGYLSYRAEEDRKKRIYDRDCQAQYSYQRTQATLLIGDDSVFQQVTESICNYLYNNYKYGKQKVQVTITKRNGELEKVQVSLLDKKAIIE